MDGPSVGEERSLTSNIIAIAMRTSEIALGIDHNYSVQVINDATIGTERKSRHRTYSAVFETAYFPPARMD
jgi:hypothetical protein